MKTRYAALGAVLAIGHRRPDCRLDAACRAVQDGQARRLTED